MRPMLATVADRVPTGDAWVHEVKWDGMRVLVDVRDGVVTVWSRNERDVTAAYPELEEIGRDYDDMLLDGEVVALDGGRPSFHALTERMHVADRRRAQRLAATRPVTLMVFDLLRLFGSDLTAQPWSARRALLDRLDLSGRNWQVPEVYEDGPQLLAATKEQGLEGIVSKRRTAPYCRRPPLAGLAQDGAPRQPVGRGGRLATGGRVERAAGRRARRPPRRQRRLALRRPRRLGPGGHRRRGAGPAAAPAAPRRPRPSPTRCRAIDAQRHDLGRAAASSSRCAPSSSPGSTGCASRPTSGCAPT